MDQIIKTIISKALEIAGLDNKKDEVLNNPEILLLIKDAEKQLLEFSGRFQDLPHTAQLFRSLTRPLLTVTFLISTLIMILLHYHIPDMLWTIDTMMTGFWFGERSIVRIMRGEI